MRTKSLFTCFSVMVMVACYSSFAYAGSVSGVLGGGVWDGWFQFQDDNVNFNKRKGVYRGEDWVRNKGKVNPGRGGQDFDAEYFFYKLVGNTLSLGIQTGFDVDSGKVISGGEDYYTGDIALSFDASFDSAIDDYSHAVDFGLLTKDNFGHNVGADGGPDTVNNKSNGTDAAGLYSVSVWNTHVIPGLEVSNPFAMDGGTFETGFSFVDSGSGMLTNSKGGTDTSFYRQVSFDISRFRNSITQELSVDAHWTMSCGNDAINGSLTGPSFIPNEVPEPGTIALLGIGLAGFAGVGARRRWQEKQLKKSK